MPAQSALRCAAPSSPVAAYPHPSVSGGVPQTGSDGNMAGHHKKENGAAPVPDRLWNHPLGNHHYHKGDTTDCRLYTTKGKGGRIEFRVSSRRPVSLCRGGAVRAGTFVTVCAARVWWRARPGIPAAGSG